MNSAINLAINELKRNGGPVRLVQLLHIIKSRYNYDMLGQFDTHRVQLHEALMHHSEVDNFGIKNKERYFLYKGDK